MTETAGSPALPPTKLQKGVFLFCMLLGTVLLILVGSKMVQDHLAGGAGPHLDSSNVGLFLLVNLNIMLLLMLGYLVVGNVVKLILDRRRKVLGSHLRARLVLAFVGLSLVPSLILFTVSRGIVVSVLKGWFSPQVKTAVEGSLGVARYHYKFLETDTGQKAKWLARDVVRALQGSSEFPSVKLRTLLDEKIDEFQLSEITLFSENGTVLLNVRKGNDDTLTDSLPPGGFQQIKDRLQQRVTLVRPERRRRTDSVRAFVAVDSAAIGGTIPPELRPAVLALSLPVSNNLSKQLARVTRSYDDFKEAWSYRIPLASTYFLTLVIVTFLIVFAAMWVAFYLARTLSGPIQLVAEGTQEIIKGNLDVKIPEVGGDELSTLVRSFNRMTEDLKHTTGELVARRRYMETVLASVEVGVISIDPAQRITTFNPAAGEILGIQDIEQVFSRTVRDALPKALADKVKEMLEEVEALGTRMATSTISLYVLHRSKQVHVTATKLVGENGDHLGTVILLDDLSELVQAQRMAAWQDVARRIAHEIKNPLTPVQLSAQRIQRRLLAESSPGGSVLTNEDSEVVQECTETIVEQVEILRTLVNEFSRFARMPRSRPQPADLNEVIEDTIKAFRHSYPEIVFDERLSPELPKVMLDREQLGRVFVNLVDNALAAIRTRLGDNAGAGGEKGSIEIVSKVSGADAIVEISDNGVGITDEDKPKLFEPYFSRNKGGTGLGLAIVYSVISEHHGTIAVHDREPTGACFEIRLPLARGSAETITEGSAL